VLPWLGQRSVFEIACTDLVEVMRKIERRRAYSMTKKCRTRIIKDEELRVD
jgi:hypothetical protein